MAWQYEYAALYGGPNEKGELHQNIREHLRKWAAAGWELHTVSVETNSFGGSTHHFYWRRQT